MASNRPPDNELQRMLEAETARQQFGGSPNIPILGQQPTSTKRWRCQVCKTIVPAMAQQVQLPGQPPFYAPDGQILTLLPGEVVPIYLCSQCDVRARRRLIPALEEIDEDDNVILPGLRVVPSDDNEEQS